MSKFRRDLVTARRMLSTNDRSDAETAIEGMNSIMAGTVEIIHTLVAPVVMISAQGLICLALYNRLAAVVGRLRVFSREYFETQTRLAGMSPEQQDSALARKLQTRLAALNGQ